MPTELRSRRAPSRAPLTAVLLVALLAAGACRPVRTSGPAPGSGSGPEAMARQPLPAVAPVDGPLAPRVVYPPADAQIQPVDSNFIHGSVGTGRATLTINGHPVRVLPNGAFIGWLPLPGRNGTPAVYEIVAVAGSDTARLSHPIRVTTPATTRPPETPRPIVPDSSADTLGLARDSAFARTTPVVVAPDTMRRWVRLGTAASDTDQVIVGRPTAAGTYKWFFTPGTRVQRVSASGDFTRVRLDSQLEIFVSTSDVVAEPGDTMPARRIASNVRLEPGDDWVDVQIQVASPPPYLLEEKGNTIELTLYGTTATTDVMRWVGNDSTVRMIQWEQVATDRVRYTLQLHQAPFGYLVMYDRGRLVLRVRRPPVVDARHPLRGMTIAVDPGHPPVGATGPTGLYEGQAVLWVSERLKRILEERGARVVMTRTTMEPVALGLRPIIARRANAHAFVSVHYNALPNGVNPFVHAVGAGTYFFRAHSEPLAREVQRRLAVRMGLEDYGIYYNNLAVVRPTWMPSILAEGAYIMMPDQEAAMRTPEYQERYALALAEGLENWLRGLAR